MKEDVGAFDHKQFVLAIRQHTGISHEDAMFVLGLVCDIANNVHAKNWLRGYNAGYNDGNITNYIQGGK